MTCVEKQFSVLQNEFSLDIFFCLFYTTPKRHQTSEGWYVILIFLSLAIFSKMILLSIWLHLRLVPRLVRCLEDFSLDASLTNLTLIYDALSKSLKNPMNIFLQTNI